MVKSIVSIDRVGPEAIRDPHRYFGALRDESPVLGMDDLLNYFRALLRRYEREPADNLITQLIRARDEGDGTRCLSRQLERTT